MKIFIFLMDFFKIDEQSNIYYSQSLMMKGLFSLFQYTQQQKKLHKLFFTIIKKKKMFLKKHTFKAWKIKFAQQSLIKNKENTRPSNSVMQQNIQNKTDTYNQINQAILQQKKIEEVKLNRTQNVSKTRLDQRNSVERRKHNSSFSYYNFQQNDSINSQGRNSSFTKGEGANQSFCLNCKNIKLITMKEAEFDLDSQFQQQISDIQITGHGGNGYINFLNSSISIRNEQTLEQIANQHRSRKQRSLQKRVFDILQEFVEVDREQLRKEEIVQNFIRKKQLQDVFGVFLNLYYSAKTENSIYNLANIMSDKIKSHKQSSFNQIKQFSHLKMLSTYDITNQQGYFSFSTSFHENPIQKKVDTSINVRQVGKIKQNKLSHSHNLSVDGRFENYSQPFENQQNEENSLIGESEFLLNELKFLKEDDNIEEKIEYIHDYLFIIQNKIQNERVINQQLISLKQYLLEQDKD